MQPSSCFQCSHVALLRETAPKIACAAVRATTSRRLRDPQLEQRDHAFNVVERSDTFSIDGSGNVSDTPTCCLARHGECSMCTRRWNMTRSTWLATTAFIISLLAGAGTSSAHLAPELGRFMQRDPAQHRDGFDLNESVRSNPIIWRDAMGLESDCGLIRCMCKDGSDAWTPVHSDSNIHPLGGGCVTLPDGIHCGPGGSGPNAMHCSTIHTDRGTEHPPQPWPLHILNHECCHVCDLKKSFTDYVNGAICDTCDRRAVPYGVPTFPIETINQPF